MGKRAHPPRDECVRPPAVGRLRVRHLGGFPGDTGAHRRPGKSRARTGSLRQGRSHRVVARGCPRDGFAGTIVLNGAARTTRVPWVVTMARTKRERLVSDIAISKTAFAPSLQASGRGHVPRRPWSSGARTASASSRWPCSSFELRTAKGKRLGVLTRLRDVLPGDVLDRTDRSRLRWAAPARWPVRADGARARRVGARRRRGGSSASSVRFTIRRLAAR